MSPSTRRKNRLPGSNGCSSISRSSRMVKGAATFREFRLENPVFHIIVYPDGSTNLEKAGPKTPVAESSDSKPLHMLIQNGLISGGTIVVTDNRQSRPASVTLQDLDLSAADVSTLPDHERNLFDFRPNTRWRSLSVSGADRPDAVCLQRQAFFQRSPGCNPVAIHERQPRSGICLGKAGHGDGLPSGNRQQAAATATGQLPFRTS